MHPPLPSLFMSHEFQLLLVRKTLEELGQFQAAKLVAQHVPESVAPSASRRLLSVLQQNVAHGNYPAIISLLLDPPHELGVRQPRVSECDGFLPLFRLAARYLAARTQYLEMVVLHSFCPDPAAEAELVPFLQQHVAPLYEDKSFRILPPPLSARVTRESEGTLLMPLAINPPTAQTLHARVLTPLVLLSETKYPHDPAVSADRLVPLLRTVLASQLQLLVAHHTRDPQPALRPEIPDRCLEALIRDALLYRASRDAFYLPSRTEPLLVHSWPPLLKPAQAASKENLPVALLHTLTDHTDEVWITRFSPLGRYLATGSLDGKGFIYDVAAGFQLVASLDATAEDEASAFVPGCLKPDFEKKKGIIYICWEPYERYLVTCCLDTVVRVWRVESLLVPVRVTRSMNDSCPVSLLSCFTLGERMRTWPCEFLPYDRNLPPHFVVGSPDRVLKVFGVDGREVLDFYTDADEWLEILENEPFSPDDGVAPAVSPDAKAEAARKADSVPTTASQFNRINDFAITPNGKVLITANNDKQVHFYKVPNMFDPAATTTKIALLTLNGRLTSCSVSANGQYVLLSVAPEELQVWDISPLDSLERPFLKQKFFGQSQAIYMVRSCFGYMKSYDQKEELVMSGSDDGGIYIWKLETGQLVTRVKGHDGLCNSVDWNRFYRPSSPAHTDYGAYWSSVGDDKLVKIWGPRP